MATKPQFMDTRPATELFSEWADKNKDEGMERGHAASVKSMLDLALPKVHRPFKAIDVGCGNGWVCRMLAEHDDCSKAVGVDGSASMIDKAKALGDGEFHLALLPEWKPEERFDMLHSMEFLYYLRDPAAMLKAMHDHWLNEGAVLIAGVDHYLENRDSHGWPEALNVHMTLMDEGQWKQAMEDAGFTDVELHRVGSTETFIGTLAMVGRKASN
jgi:trans-aconitate methyltransferase